MAPILLVSYAGVMGGAERVLLEFSAELEGERILVCPEGALAEAARTRGLRVLPQLERPLSLRASLADRARATASLASHAARIIDLVRALEPELVVLSGMRSALTLGARRLPVPVVVDHHDWLPGRWVGGALRRAMRGASLVVVPSQAVAADLGFGSAADPSVEVIPPGVDLERFRPVGEPSRPPIVLTLGAVVDWKRPDLAVAVAARARQLTGESRLSLRLAGAPLDAAGEALAARLADEPGVSVAPAPDVPATLCAASVLLHCAEREPFGVALVEAMAAGRPVVAPASGGPAEIIDQSCGSLYPPGDVEAAAHAVADLLTDSSKATEMGRAGRARAEAHFDVRRTRSQFAAAAARVQRPAASLGDGSGLAIVTVAYESAPELAELLASIARHLPACEVVVADNGSSDASVEVARAAGARVLELGVNLGFGTACNRALATVTAPTCALLNPDVLLLDDSLLHLAREAAAGDRLLAPLVLASDGSRQDSVHPLPGSPADFGRAVLPYTRLPFVTLAPWRARVPLQVGWAIGAALVASTELLHRLGPFDERIFLYGEDLDLALRARAGGIPTWFDPRARVLHHGGRSAARAFGEEPVDRLAQARREVVARVLGPQARRRDTSAAAIRYLTRIAARRALGRPAERERAQLRALW